MSQLHLQLMFEKFMKLHDEAYKIIEEGKRISLSGDKKKAIVKYEAAHRILNEALSIQYPSGHDVSGNRIRKMKNKMKRVKKQVLYSISACERSQAFASSSSAVSSHIMDVSLTSLQMSFDSKTACILYTHPKAQIYFISSNGCVNTFSNPDTLEVVKSEGGKQFYLQVGRWKYSLEPGTSSWIRTKENTFIFHEPHSQGKGDAVALTLGNVGYESDSGFNLLYEVLNQIVEAVRPPVNGNHRGLTDNISLDVSQAIVRGADFFSHTITRGAERVSQLMNDGTPELINIIPRERVPSEVSPEVQAGLHVARNVTEVVGTVTGFLASCIGSATMMLGRYLAPHIQRQGTRLLTENFDYSEHEAAETVDRILQVTAGAVEGFATVYEGLQQAGRILGRSLTTNTVKIVEHKYGSSAAAATGDAMYTVGNTLTTRYNMRRLTLKASAKQTTRGVGKYYGVDN